MTKKIINQKLNKKSKKLMWGLWDQKEKTRKQSLKKLRFKKLRFQNRKKQQKQIKNKLKKIHHQINLDLLL